MPQPQPIRARRRPRSLTGPDKYNCAALTVPGDHPWPGNFQQWIHSTSEVPPLIFLEGPGADVKLFDEPCVPRLNVPNNDFLSVSPQPFPSEVLSMFSCDAPSSAGSTFSPVQTERGDGFQRSPSASPLGKAEDNFTASTEVTVSLSPKNSTRRGSLICLGPQCHMTFQSDAELRTHVQAVHTHTCSWAGCEHAGFSSRNDLNWHVKVAHLLICPVAACTEASFQSNSEVQSHIAIAHPGAAKESAVKAWELPPPATAPSFEPLDKDVAATNTDSRFQAAVKEVMSVARAKKRCQEQMWNVIEKKARKTSASGTPRPADSPTDLVRGRTARPVLPDNFPLVFEHAVLPFLTEFIPKWSGPRHVISCTRGRKMHSRRICIMTTAMLSRTRKIIIAQHVSDLLPEEHRRSVSFVFSVGQISRAACWARGLGRAMPDDVRFPRNPYFFNTPCMGDSIGAPGEGAVPESTATLGPCLRANGGLYWLVNFHPFMDAYHERARVDMEHPSPQDRESCLGEKHDAMAETTSFKLGRLAVTSGLNLKTTRLSHDPYWKESGKAAPLVVTDWALIAASGSSSNRANMLRRFPSETLPPVAEPLVTTVSPGVPAGAMVISSGRTSGYQRGQVCEIPAYVSAEENGTGKATREWFVEEPISPSTLALPSWAGSNEDAWIRGGIGAEGDSGAAIVDAETNSLVGQLWGRNKYWGPGPRITFFTPTADILDDIHEKCGLQERPELPQTRDDSDRYAAFPSCRRCYDANTYLDSRRSSRASLQSMINCTGDADLDLTSNENVSELATPRDYHRGGGPAAVAGIEEIGSSFGMVSSPAAPFTFSVVSPSTRSPYPATLDIMEPALVDRSNPGNSLDEFVFSAPAAKRRSICLDAASLGVVSNHVDTRPKRTKTIR